MFVIVDSFPLMAVPYFILAGELMERGGISLRLVKFALGPRRSCPRGLCARGRPGQHDLRRRLGLRGRGYRGHRLADHPRDDQEGLPARLGGRVPGGRRRLGPIIPPSIVMLIYASIANQSPARMFLGGIVPGVLIGLGLMAASYIYSVRHGYGVGAAGSARDILRSDRRGGLGAGEPGHHPGRHLLGRLHGHRGGGRGRRLRLPGRPVRLPGAGWKDLPAALVKAALTTTIVMFIVAASGIFGWLLAAARAPLVAAAFLQSITTQPFLVFLIVIGFLLIVGGLMEEAASIIILVPVLHPMAQRFGIDPLHWAVILSITLVVGAVTPPVASFLFISTAIAKTNLDRVLTGGVAVPRDHGGRDPALRGLPPADPVPAALTDGLTPPRPAAPSGWWVVCDCWLAAVESGHAGLEPV